MDDLQVPLGGRSHMTMIILSYKPSMPEWLWLFSFLQSCPHPSFLSQAPHTDRTLLFIFWLVWTQKCCFLGLSSMKMMSLMVLIITNDSLFYPHEFIDRFLNYGGIQVYMQHKLLHRLILNTTVAMLWLQEHRSNFSVSFRSLSWGNRFIPSSRFAKQLMTETNDNSPNSLNCSAVSDGVPDVHGSVVSKDDSSRGKELLFWLDWWEAFLGNDAMVNVTWQSLSSLAWMDFIWPEQTFNSGSRELGATLSTQACSKIWLRSKRPSAKHL